MAFPQVRLPTAGLHELDALICFNWDTAKASKELFDKDNWYLVDENIKEPKTQGYFVMKKFRSTISIIKALLCFIIISNLLPFTAIGNAYAGEYLGRIGGNPFCSDCTANPFAPIANPFHPNSLNNPFGKYGNPFSPYSPNNPFATDTPEVYGTGDE